MGWKKDKNKSKGSSGPGIAMTLEAMDEELEIMRNVLAHLKCAGQPGIGRIVRYFCDRFGVFNPNGHGDTSAPDAAGVAYWRKRIVGPEEKS